MQEAAESQNESHMDLDVSSIEADDLQVFLQIKKECRPGSSDLIMESLVELPERRDSSIAADLTSDIPSVKRNDQPEISDSAKLNMLIIIILLFLLLRQILWALQMRKRLNGRVKKRI
eukprot:m.134526 g.134526  ORF g.134526 m.134526 type:complete len:118 (+) comp38142_c0_seq6:554-907(+)